MSGIRGKDTKPELLVRYGLHAQGFRYRLHDSSMPGNPDLVFPKYRAVIFVHGCFWHGHDCHLFKWPKENRDFWRQKISGNKDRDRGVVEKMTAMGWRVLIIWECAVKGKERIPTKRVIAAASEWLVSGKPAAEIRGMKNGVEWDGKARPLYRSGRERTDSRST